MSQTQGVDPTGSLSFVVCARVWTEAPADGPGRWVGHVVPLETNERIPVTSLEEIEGALRRVFEEHGADPSQRSARPGAGRPRRAG